MTPKEQYNIYNAFLKQKISSIRRYRVFLKIFFFISNLQISQSIFEQKENLNEPFFHVIKIKLLFTFPYNHLRELIILSFEQKVG